MKKKIRAAIIIIVLMGLLSFFSEKISSGRDIVHGNIYEFTMTALDGKKIDFSQYKGKRLLIVNTASKCGYTPQYEDLQQLHEQYGDEITILGFPANNFLWQEPGSNSEIANFCQKNYGVTFQMFEKISVKGNQKHPLYKWLSSKSGKNPSWNFCKYYVSSDGNNVLFFPPDVKPTDPIILKLIGKI